MDEIIAAARALAAGARRVAVLTGAGFSRPSGIPDFRSPEGVWARSDPTQVASIGAFRQNPEAFYHWFWGLLEPVMAARPNPAHLAVAALEAEGRVEGVVTQNIDGLHQRAGSRRVFELHGNLRGATCLECGRQVPGEPVLTAARRGRAPRCSCGGLLKPDVVLFDEGLPRGVFWLAQRAIEQCDLLLIAGTSLEVAPACDLPLAALDRGVPVVIVNLAPTPLDDRATAVVRADVATAVPAILGYDLPGN
ncbi:MAG: NAD-dependent protein deacetylase [Chloroflexi bacterium OHK40]